MLEELNRRLMEAKENVRSYRKLLADADRLWQTMEGERRRLAELKRKLDSEKADVDRLEGLSLTGLFYSILGSKQQQIDKERQEYLAAKLKFDQCQSSVSALQRDVDDLRGRAKDLDGSEARLEEILKQKEEAIASGGHANSAALMALGEEQADANADLKELAEAIDAGNSVLRGLDEVVGLLGSARNWGTWDMLGGGLISTAIKHSKIDGAKAAAGRVQHALRRFESELADVGASGCQIDIEMGGFATFADYFFDGLISDWIVQSRINRSLAEARDVEARVRSVVAKLESEQAAVKARLSDIGKRRNSIIEDA